jgi:hypothetical protein
MALAHVISKQPTEKLHSLKTMRLTLGFLAIGSQLIRTVNAAERRWSGLWPPVFRVSGPGPSFLPGQSLPSFANFRFGRAQTDSIVDGDRLAQFM